MHYLLPGGRRVSLGPAFGVEDWVIHIQKFAQNCSRIILTPTHELTAGVRRIIIYLSCHKREI